MLDFARLGPLPRTSADYAAPRARLSATRQRARALHESPPPPDPSSRTSSGEARSASPEDVELVRRALADQREAFRDLALRLRCIPRALHALNLRLGRPFDHARIDDMAQDALIVIWRKLDRFSGESALETWAYGIARFEFANALRRLSRRGVDVEVPRSTPAPAPSERAEDALDHAVLHEALEKLEPEARAVIRLKHFADRTFEEIAAALSISPNTAKSRYYRGMKRLETLLAPRFGVDP